MTDFAAAWPKTPCNAEAAMSAMWAKAANDFSWPTKDKMDKTKERGAHRERACHD
jgi:hypothetical protein